MKTRLIPLLIAVMGAVMGAGIGLAANAHAEGAVEETRPLSAGGSVSVENVAGEVMVEGWDREEVAIRGELGDTVEELEISGSENSLKIRVRNRHGGRNVDDTALYLSVPRHASVELNAVSADLGVKGLDSKSVLLESVSGDITIVADAERLEAESVSGDVEYSGKSSRVSVETVSGEIDIHGGEGEVRVSTVSGDLELRGGMLSHGRFETVSGDLTVEAGVTGEGRLNAASMSGDVDLELPAGQEGEFTLETYSGRIESNFGPGVEGGAGAGTSWSHREGSGGATIRVESFSGDVTVRRP